MNATLVLGATLLALTTVCLLLVAVTVVAKVRRTRRERALAVLAAPQRLLVLTVASGEDDDDAAATILRELPAAQWASIRPAVMGLLGKVRGLPAQRLVEIAAAHGEIEAARARLTSRSTVLRARGARVLGLVRDAESVPALRILLRDPRAEVRLVAARSLGLIGDPAAAADVLAAAAGKVPAWIVAEALLGMGPEIEPIIADGLVDTDARVRSVAVTVTTHATMPVALGIIRECLHFEPDPEVKAEMIVALGRLGTVGDAGLLLGYTGRFAPRALRRTCVRALGELTDPAALARLRDMLADPDRATAAAAANALVGFGSAGADLLDSAREQGRDAARVAAAAQHLARLRADAGVAA